MSLMLHGVKILRGKTLKLTIKYTVVFVSSCFHVNFLPIFEKKQSEISQFAGPTTVDNHVGGLEVSVYEYRAAMEIVKSLHKDEHDE